MRLVISDDHRVVLDAIGAALVARGHEVVALAPTAQQALDDVTRHNPDACLMDYRYPQGTCTDVVRSMTERHPRTKVVVLTADTDPQVVADVLAAGASGFVSKSASLAEIVDALERARLGQVVVEHRLLQQSLRTGRSETSLYGLRFLTDREWDVLKCITQGLTTKQIASKLGISHATARTHVQRLLAKLGVHSRLEAVALVSQQGRQFSWPRRLQ